MPKLYEIQQEIKKYFTGKKTNPKILSLEIQRELSVYKSLALEKLNATLKKAFPLCYKILKDYWVEVVLDFYHSFPSKSGIYLQVTKNFSSYLNSFKFKLHFRKTQFPPWLHELAEYEWASVDLSNFHRTELNLGSSKSLSDNDQVRLIKAHKIFKFNYPVSKIVEHLGSKRKKHNIVFFKKQKETLLIFRDRENQIRYFLLSAGTYFLVDNLRYGISVSDLLEKFIEKFNIKEKDNLDTNRKILDLLSNFKHQGILT
jgi:hypothetical protein